MLRQLVSWALFVLGAISILPMATHAQVTGPSDAGRIERRVLEEMRPTLTPAPAQSVGGGKSTAQPAPKGSEGIRFVLKSVVLQGNSQLDPAAIKETYAEYLDKEISLDTLWLIAGRITERYQQAGHFLSRVYVPQQEIGGGAVKLNVIEGFISELDLDENARANPLVGEIVQPLLYERPLNSAQLERVLSCLNALPGQTYRAVLELPTDKNAAEGATRLSIVTTTQKPQAYFSYDNNGSRFLGPYEISQSVSMSLLPNHRTDITALATTQAEELKYGSIRHSVALTGNWVVDGSVGITKAQPGYTLEVQEILSLSRSLGMGATYQWWRDRDDSLSTRIGLDAREVSSKLLGTQLSEDNIRTIRASTNYTGSDGAEGSSSLNATLTRGLSMFGASNAGDVNLTRAEAEPDFTKIELSASRYQRLPADLMLVGAMSAQLASGPLYASEEFGYGGQNFGRAYDNSEITGDHGAAASVELRYLGLPVTYDTQLVPYAFYDIGKVWNEDRGQRKPIDASSAGAAVRVVHESGVSSNLGVAFPLTRPIATPITGRDQGPRIMMQAGIAF